MNMHAKIETARAILNCKELQNNKSLILKLKQITDRYELVYNDVKIKHLKSRNAKKMMKELEIELDKILAEAKIQSS